MEINTKIRKFNTKKKEFPEKREIPLEKVEINTKIRKFNTKKREIPLEKVEINTKIRKFNTKKKEFPINTKKGKFPWKKWKLTPK